MVDLSRTSSFGGESEAGRDGAMKYCVTVFLIVCALPIANTEIYSGTVVYLDFSQDEVTIAADSRMTSGQGETDDTDCKVSAFGDKFVFVSVGAAKGEGWQSRDVARRIWETESKSHFDAPGLTRLVSDEWTERMEKIYAQPEIIGELRQHMTGQPVLAEGFFSASDKSGNLVVRAVDISLDSGLFDSTGQVHILHQSGDAPVGAMLIAGYNEVIREFRDQSSSRSKQYMAWFLPQLPLQPSEKRAALASKYVELSILLHPNNSKLAFPIDILQLRRGTGVHWVSLKPNCARK